MITTSTIQLYGDVIGSATANTVAFVCGVPACALAQTYSTVLSATSANQCGTLVLRDSNCNFFANNITANLTGTATFAIASLTTVSAQYANSTNFAFTSSVAQFANIANFAYTSSSALYSTTALYATNALLSVTSQYAQNAGSANFAFTSSVAQFANVANSANYICGVPACNLVSTFSQVLSGTSFDIPLTLVLRDSTGSFAATNVTVTGQLQLQGTSNNTVALQAPASSSYTLLLPFGTGTAGQVLTTAGGSPDQLTWTTPTVITTSTIQLYGDVIGSATANTVAFVCGVPACALAQTYSTVLSATSANQCGTLVLRDSNCNFFANNITANLTGTATFAIASLTTVSAQYANSTNFAFTSSVAQFANIANFAYTSSSALYSTTALYATNALLSVTAQYAQNAGSANFAFTSSVAQFANVANSANYICGVPACNLVSTFSQVLSGTSFDIPLTLVLRDSTGSFAATNVTVTGLLQLQGTGVNTVNLQACPTTPAYTLQLPCTVGSAGQYLSISSQTGNTDVLTWSTPMAITTTTMQLYGDVIGSLTANTVAFVCGVPACNLVSTFSQVLSGTSFDIPLTLVLRDSTGSFAATNVTVTGLLQLQGTGVNTVNLQACPTTPAYTLQLPCTVGSAGQYLSISSQTGNTDVLTWSTPMAITTTTMQLYGDVIGSLTANTVAFVCGVPACNLVSTFSQVLSGTSFDIPLTLVLRDSTGSFAATNVTVTGLLQLQGTGVNTVNLQACPTTPAYTLQLPCTVGSAGQYLSISSQTGNTDVLTWSTPMAITTTTMQLYGDVIGSLTANTVAFVCGVPACNLVSTFSQVLSGTSFDIPLTLVLRDSTGSFAATNVTVTGLLQLQGTGVNTVNLQACPTTPAYTLQLPCTVGSAGQYLSIASQTGNTDVLTWTTPSAMLTGTYCDIQNSIVARDGAGSFAATTITLTSVNLLNYNPVYQSCPSPNATTAFLSVPGTNNLFLGINAGSQALTGNGGNVAIGSQALMGITTGTSNTAVGYNALNLMSSGYNNVAYGVNAGSANTSGSNNIYLGTNPGVNGESNTIYIGTQGIQTTAYMAGITNNSLSNVSLVGIVNGTGQLGVVSSASITTLTVTSSLYVDNLNGAVIATNGLLTATIGIDGTRLASFPLTDTPPVQFFQPVEPSRESYFFDDFIAFNASAGGVFYGDTPWVISNNSYPSRVTSLKSTSSAVGITRLLTGNTQDSLNYLIKQINPGGTTSYGVGFGLGPCINEWRVSLPAATLSLASTFTVFCGMGDNVGSTPYMPQNGIYFSYTNTSPSAPWQINTAFNGLTMTMDTVPATSPQAGVFQRLGFMVNALTSQVDFFINDVKVGTLNADIPDGNDCSPCASIRTGGSPGAIDLDYWYYHYTFNLRR